MLSDDWERHRKLKSIGLTTNWDPIQETRYHCDRATLGAISREQIQPRDQPDYTYKTPEDRMSVVIATRKLPRPRPGKPSQVSESMAGKRGWGESTIDGILPSLDA